LLPELVDRHEQQSASGDDRYTSCCDRHEEFLEVLQSGLMQELVDACAEFVDDSLRHWQPNTRGWRYESGLWTAADDCGRHVTTAINSQSQATLYSSASIE